MLKSETIIRKTKTNLKVDFNIKSKYAGNFIPGTPCINENDQNRFDQIKFPSIHDKNKHHHGKSAL